MMTEAEIERALIGWRAAISALNSTGYSPDVTDWSRGLAEGYASALEMVLRG